jgi:hypothetical protein
MSTAEVYPFTDVGEYSGEPYPDWLRGLKRKSGVYLIRERESGDLAYIGESHTERLYSTLTRHLQDWAPHWGTASPTYRRGAVDVGVVVVPKSHALYLQDELICALEPRDNRLMCGDLFAELGDRKPPRGYDHDVIAIIEAIFSSSTFELEDVPF